MRWRSLARGRKSAQDQGGVVRVHFPAKGRCRSLFVYVYSMYVFVKLFAASGKYANNPLKLPGTSLPGLGDPRCGGERGGGGRGGGG